MSSFVDTGAQERGPDLEASLITLRAEPSLELEILFNGKWLEVRTQTHHGWVQGYLVHKKPLHPRTFLLLQKLVVA